MNPETSETLKALARDLESIAKSLQAMESNNGCICYGANHQTNLGANSPTSSTKQPSNQACKPSSSKYEFLQRCGRY